MRITNILAKSILPACLALAILSPAAAGGELEGTARIGYTIIDDEGNRGVQESTYNIYEGLGVSLERVKYRFNDGTRVTANLENLTLNNRNLVLGLSKHNLFGLSVRSSQYRRTYSAEGDNFTRRRRTGGEAWVQPHRLIRLFGGYGIINRHGRTEDILGEFGPPGLTDVDFSHTHYHAGLRLGESRSYARVEYRGSDFTDNADAANDSRASRIRVTAATPVPRYENFAVNAGFQHYCRRLENRDDTLSANTVWGGARFFFGDGYQVKYSFIFDRASRTGDLAATDNITHAVAAGRTWRGKGGITVGYQHRINDDVRDELTANGYFVSGWFRPATPLTVRGGYGNEATEVQSGRTLTGDEDYTKHWLSARYKHDLGTARAKFEFKRRENENIGSKVDFYRYAADLSITGLDYAELVAAYAYHDGTYENADGTFEFGEHVLSGDVLSKEYRGFQGGIGGMYFRTSRDLDVESFTLRLLARYRMFEDYRMEVVYSAHNFDDFDDPSPVYSRYYTSNVVQISLMREL